MQKTRVTSEQQASSACTPCAIGSYNSEVGQDACISCGLGKGTPRLWTTMRLPLNDLKARAETDPAETIRTEQLQKKCQRFFEVVSHQPSNLHARSSFYNKRAISTCYK
eukprot:1326648-Amphidinium_carterae.1